MGGELRHSTPPESVRKSVRLRSYSLLLACEEEGRGRGVTRGKSPGAEPKVRAAKRGPRGALHSRAMRSHTEYLTYQTKKKRELVHLTP